MHWLTLYDDDGDPYGVTCTCEIGTDHDGYGSLIDV
jgi:hypothetical protein